MTLVVAHRGASAHERENTTAAFRRARELGADWVELDVRPTADGELAVHHDAHLSDGRAVSLTQMGDLPFEIPSLGAALDACEGMGVNIEIKHDPSEPGFNADRRLARCVVDFLRVRRSAERILVSSFDRRIATEVRQLDPTLAVGWLLDRGQDLALAVHVATESGLQALHPHHEGLSAADVSLAQEAGLAVNVWTIDDPARMAELATMGVDALITNRPDLGRQVLSRLAEGA